MNKEFVPYELAVKLKELGFDEPCFGCYTKDGELSYDFSDNKGEGHYFQDCSAPTFSQVFRWFRERYKLNGRLNHYPNTKEWDCSVHNLEWSGKELLEYIKTEDRTVKYLNYEEAELACLTKLIEIIETKSE